VKINYKLILGSVILNQQPHTTK